MSDENELVSAEEARGLLENATPGPWRSGWDCADTGEAVPLIYSVNSKPGDNDGKVVFGMWYDGPRTACTEQNAALLAAAPNLARTAIALHARVEAVEAERDARTRNAGEWVDELLGSVQALRAERDEARRERDRLARILAPLAGHEYGPWVDWTARTDCPIDDRSVYVEVEYPDGVHVRGNYADTEDWPDVVRWRMVDVDAARGEVTP